MTPTLGSFRREPDDARPLWERIDAQVLERISDAVDAFCLEALVRSRRERGRPMPAADSVGDRAEFEALVAAFLGHLRTAVGSDLSRDQSAKVAAAEARAPAGGSERLLAAQVTLAKLLPDYWTRFEAAGRSFPPPTPEGAGWRGRLFGRDP